MSNSTISHLLEPPAERESAFSAIASNLLLFMLIFGMSATVDVKNLSKQLRNTFAIGCGVIMQFVVMPFLGYLAVKMFSGSGLTVSMGVTLLVVTASPGGSYSNWWCSMFNADLALSVAMTTVSSILSIVLLPANLIIYTSLAYGMDEEDSIVSALDFQSLFTSLVVVLSAIVLGLAASYTFDYPTFHQTANKFGSISGLLLILFSIFLAGGGGGGSDDGDSESKASPLGAAFYIGVAMPCLLGLLLANVCAKAVNLSSPETVTIAIECCYQNTGIATAVAIAMFDDPAERSEAVAVPLFYGIVEALAIGLYCVFAWKAGWTKAPADEKFWVMIATSYEETALAEPTSTGSAPTEKTSLV